MTVKKRGSKKERSGITFIVRNNVESDGRFSEQCNSLSPQVLKYPSLLAINHCVESNLIEKRYKKHSGWFLLLILISTRKRSTWGMKNRHMAALLMLAFL